MNPTTKKIFKTQFKVRELLTDIPDLRDDSTRLVCYYWMHELEVLGHTITGSNIKTLFTFVCNGTLTQADTITRASRKIQQDIPQLRGKSWKKRKGIEVEVREEITKI